MELRLRNISKSFPGVRALDGMDLAIRPGEVHALCGENGAGKSTLLNIMTGNLRPDSGEMHIDGRRVVFYSPREACLRGIAIVYQQLSLIEYLSIGENVYGGFPPENKYGFLRKKEMYRKTDLLLDKLHLPELRAHQPVSSLSAGQKQMIEMAKALAVDPQVILLDEPTASLSEKEAQVIFRIVRQLKEENKSVLYISHRLKEVLALADTITVLKDGKGQGSYPAPEVTEDRLVQLMVGRPLRRPVKSTISDQRVLWEINGLTGKGFDDIRFTIHAGEILGLAGLIGSGRTEIAQTLFGAAKARSGSLRINGADVNLFRNPGEAISKHMAYLPEDRKTQGIFPDKSVAENIYLSQLIIGSGYRKKALEKKAAALCSFFDVRTSSIHKKAGELSGGNQQKLLLARWLSVDPQIVLLDEPTQGIDVGAREEIYAEIRRLAGKGKGILLISSEVIELLQLCDRILVLKEGRIAGELTANEATEEKLISLAMR